ncbi:methyltransferase domain-containing protein [Streptomyces sp. NPDC053367]|uniref:methyltransferase domain-containing protein n=1 Tax=Streptomyces sp. NPDC053367 TaxID=3365700 RepID=UPI0037D183C2
MTDNACPLMTALADELVKAEAIRTPPWREAFATVPRHVFVPEWFEQETDDRGIAVWRQRTAEQDLAAVYRDVTLVTALDPATAERVDETAWTGIPTSSGTLPSLMAGMLESLTVQDGHRVLEIGTGTGYNAALLCARLGDADVSSVDVDAALVDAARARLANLGYEPHLLACDGTQGYPGQQASFDRIIATCSVPHVPTAWLEQLGPGGILLTDVSLGIEGGLVRLSARGDGRARGFFTTVSGRFMPARADAQGYPAQECQERAPTTGSRSTVLTAAAIRAHYPLRLALAFHLPRVELVYYADEAGTALQLQRGDGSWARVPLAGDDTGVVTYGGGDDELWKQAEAAWEWWNSAGRPDQDRFGYARESDGGAYVWHIPDGAAWRLPV